MRASLSLLLLVVLGLAAPLFTNAQEITATGTATGNTYNVTASTPFATIQLILDNLKAGDVLNFLPGLYANLALNVKVSGTASAWITIRGVLCGTEKPILQIDTDILQLPAITISAGANFVLIQDLQIAQLGAQVVAGIDFVTSLTGSISNIILQDLILDSINGNGIDLLDVNNVVNVLVSGTVLSNIGLVTNVVGNIGAGFIVGGLVDPVVNVVNIQFLNNVVHDVFGQVGSAVQVLLGVVSPRIVDNVIWNVANGVLAQLNAAIKVVTGIAEGDLLSLPLVARNFIFDILNCNNNKRDAVSSLASVVALEVGAGVQVVNNVIFNVQNAINVVLGGCLDEFINTLIAHNTIYGVVDVVLTILDDVVATTLRILNNVLAVGNTGGIVLNLACSILDEASDALILNNVVQGILTLEIAAGADAHSERQVLPGLAGFIPLDLDGIFTTVSDVLTTLQLLPTEALANDILDAVVGIVDQVGQTVSGVLHVVKELVHNLVYDLDQVIDALGDPLGLGLNSPLKNILKAVDGTVGNLVDNVDQTVDNLLNNVDDIVYNINSDIYAIVPNVDDTLDVLKQILGTTNGLVNGLLGNLGRRQVDVSAVNQLLDEELFGTLQNVVGDVNGVVVGANAALASTLGATSIALNSILATVDGELADQLGTVNGIVNDLIRNLAAGTITNEVAHSLQPLLSSLLRDVKLLLASTVDEIDELLADVLGLVDFNGNVRLGRFTIGALQLGGAIQWPFQAGFKGLDVQVTIPCVLPPTDACPAKRGLARS